MPLARPDYRKRVADASVLLLIQAVTKTSNHPSANRPKAEMPVMIASILTWMTDAKPRTVPHFRPKGGTGRRLAHGILKKPWSGDESRSSQPVDPNIPDTGEAIHESFSEPAKAVLAVGGRTSTCRHRHHLKSAGFRRTVRAAWCTDLNSGWDFQLDWGPKVSVLFDLDGKSVIISIPFPDPFADWPSCSRFRRIGAGDWASPFVSPLARESNTGQ